MNFCNHGVHIRKMGPDIVALSIYMITSYIEFTSFVPANRRMIPKMPYIVLLTADAGI